MRTRFVSLIAAGLAAAPVATQDDRAAAWREDLAHVAARIPEMHPDPFHNFDAETFRTAVQELDERIPRLTDAQIIVELMRVVALLGRGGREGHSGVDASRVFSHLPLQLYEFPEGIFVVAAAPDHADLVGSQVLEVGGRDIAELLRAIDPLVPRDSEANAMVRRLFLVRMPELLHALGLIERADTVDLRVCMPGAETDRTVELAGQTVAELRAWAGQSGFTLPPAEQPRHLAHRDDAFRFEYLFEHDAIYMQYHAVRARSADGESIARFTARLSMAVAANPGARLVIDVRHNGGGDNTTYRPLLAQLVSNPEINAENRLFLLIGRATFSAAGNFVTEVERLAKHVILVGEPTGGSPNQYGDARDVKLPNHPDVIVRVATRYHEKAPGDERLTHEPDLPVALTAADYFAGRDPVLETALRHGR